MKKALIFAVLALFSLITKAQISPAYYIGHSVASDTSLFLITEKNSVTVWDVNIGKTFVAYFHLRQEIKAAGFVDSRKVGIVFNQNGVDKVLIYEILTHQILKEISLGASYFNYTFHYDKERFYISSLNHAKSWTYNKFNETLIKVEDNAVYTSNGNVIVKHHYKPTASESYAIQNLNTGKFYLGSVLDILSFNTESFNITGDKLIIANAEQVSTVNIFDIRNRVNKISVIEHNQGTINFISFINNDQILIIDCSINLAAPTLIKSNCITIKDLKGNLISTAKLNDGNLSNISISFDRKYLIYHNSNFVYSVKI